MTIISKYSPATTFQVPAQLEKFHKKHGGIMGETLFCGPTLYFAPDFGIKHKAEKAGLVAEFRANYESLAVYTEKWA